MPGGRPTKLDPEAANTITALLQKGMVVEDCAAAAGVSSSCYFKWMAKGEKLSRRTKPLSEAERPFLQFFQSCKKAVALGIAYHVGAIEKAGDGTKDQAGDWKAHAWLLERMHPKKFGRKYIRIESTGPDGEPGPVPGAPAPVVEITIEGNPEVPEP